MLPVAIVEARFGPTDVKYSFKISHISSGFLKLLVHLRYVNSLIVLHISLGSLVFWLIFDLYLFAFAVLIALFIQFLTFLYSSQIYGYFVNIACLFSLFRPVISSLSSEVIQGDFFVSYSPCSYGLSLRIYLATLQPLHQEYCNILDFRKGLTSGLL